MLWVKARSFDALGPTIAILIGSSAERPASSSSAQAATAKARASIPTSQACRPMNLLKTDMSFVPSS